MLHLTEERPRVVLPGIQGQRAAFEAKMALASQNDLDEWACMQVLVRAGSVVTRIGVPMGFTSAQLDTFFRNAAKL